MSGVDITQMNSSSILDYFINYKVVDSQECKEEIALIWKQMRLLVTKKASQEETREYLEAGGNIQKVFNKMNEIVQSNLFHFCSIDSFFFQFIANFITGNAQNKVFITEALFHNDEIYYDIIQAIYDPLSLKDFKLRKFICTFLYNFLKDLDLNIVLSKLFNSLSFQHILKGVIVEFLLNETNDNIDLKEETQQIQTQNQEVQVIYWTLILISQLFNSLQAKKISLFQYFETLFVSKNGVNLIQQEDESYIAQCKDNQSYTMQELVSNNIFEKFQLFLFHISQQFIDEKVNCSFVKGLEPTIIDVRCEYVKKKDYKFMISINDFDYICKQFIQIHQTLHNLLTEQKAFEPLIQKDNEEQQQTNEVIDQEKKQIFSYYLTQLHDKLRIFCMMTFLGGYNNQLQKRFIELGLFKDVLEFNIDLQKINSLAVQTSKPLINRKKQCLIYFSGESYQDIFSSIIRLLSNIVHINREGQDYIKDNNYLVSCLNQTHMDETNPLQREWSVMLIRNLCDSNDEMQAAISNLKIFQFNDKTQEVLQKYQSKKEELEKIRTSIKEGTLMQDSHQFQQNDDENDHYHDDESEFYKKD